MKTCKPFLLSAFCLAQLTGGGQAAADTYRAANDYEVVCLHLNSGKPCWRAKPGKLEHPRITVRGARVRVESLVYVFRGFTATHTYLLDAKSGRVQGQLKGAPKRSGVGPLPPLPVNLTTRDQGRVVYDPRNTRHLELTRGGKKVLVQRLDDYPHGVQVLGKLVLFSYAGGGSSIDKGGGEVYAYDLQRRRLAWEFDAARAHRNLPESERTNIAVDRSTVLVMVDQQIIALEGKSGRLLWRTKLPRQRIRRYDSAGGKATRVGSLLLVACYERLFALNAKDGALKWSFDAGTLGKPWPTLHRGKLYLAARRGGLRYGSRSFTRRHVERASALRVRRGKSRCAHDLAFISRRSVPPDHTPWWSLRAPPRRKAGQRKVTLVLHNTSVDERGEALRYDLSAVLQQRGEAYVRVFRHLVRAELHCDGVRIQSAHSRPGHPQER